MNLGGVRLSAVRAVFFSVASLLWPLLAIVSVANGQDEKLKLEILNGHSGGGVLSVAVSSDGKFALTGSTDQTALLWDLATGKQLRRFVGHEAAVRSVSFSKDGQFVLTASHDKTARLWETATGKQVRVFVENRNGVLIGHSGKILTAAISADGNMVATAGEDKTARIWDLKTGKQLFQIDHAGRVNSIAFSPDSKYLLTGGEDKIARLYSTSDGEFVRQFVGHTGEITSVAYSPDGSQILTGSYNDTGSYKDLGSYDDNNVRLWDAKTTAGIRRFGPGKARTVAFTPSGRGVIAGGLWDEGYGYQGGVYLWDVVSGEKEVLVTNYIAGAGPLAMTKDEKRILYLDNPPNIVAVLEIQDEKEFYLIGQSDIVNSIDISPNFRLIATGGNDNTSGLWSLVSGQTVKRWRIDGQEALRRLWERLRAPSPPGQVKDDPIYASDDSKSVAFSPNGDLLGRTLHEHVQLYDTTTYELKRQFRIEPGIDIKALAFSPDGKAILTIGNNGKLLMLNVETGVEIRRFIGHEEQIYSVAFSSNGKMIASAGHNKTVRLWDTETGEVKQIIKDFPTPVWAVAFSPDGKTIATASDGEVDISKVSIADLASANSVQFWDVETGKKIESFGGQFKSFSSKITGSKSVAYSADGKYIAAGAFDGKVYIRDNTTKQLRKLEGHTDVVNSVKFSADGKYIVSGSSDSTTRIWNAATGEEICKLVTFRDGTWAVVDPKGRYDAPNGGEIEGIQWVYGNETIALNQLKDVFYTPNLLPRLLGYNKEPFRPVPDLNSLKLFPKIVEQKLDEANVRLTVKLQNRGGGIGEVRVLVNGKLATEDARTEKQKADWNKPGMDVSFDLKGSAGFDPKRKNTIEVITNNYDPQTRKGYISSRSVSIAFAGNGREEVKQPTLFAVVGGVSDYNGSQMDLRFAAKDAQDFANALGIGARRLFCPVETPNCTDKVKIKLLTTSGKDGTMLPTKANFRAAFEEVAKEAKPEDVMVVYLSGHGTSLNLDGTDTYLYMTQDADKNSKEALAVREYREAATISSTELTNWLTQERWVGEQKGIQAGKQVMILDTCAAGAFETKISFQATKDLSADQIRALERLKDRTGFQILMGSAADAVSYEASEYGQGLLTYALLQGMKGAKLRDGKYVDTQLLFGYAADEVPNIVANLNGGIQRPRIFGSTGIDIGLMTDIDKNAIKLESVKPVFLRPLFSSGDENDDPLDLIGALRRGLEELSSARSRGDGKSGGAELVYIDDDGFPNAFRVTGRYTIEGDNIRMKAFLRKDGKTVAPLPEVVAGREKVIDELLTAIRIELAKIGVKGQ